MSSRKIDYTLIMPMDEGRMDLFLKSKAVYDQMPFVKEILVPTRTINKLDGVKLLPYEWNEGFNCSKALNLGVREAKSDYIIITSPEIKPKPDVLEKLSKLKGQNVICQVWDENERGEPFMSLVNSYFRGDSPAMYFLAMFNKKDIEKINGWDEDFMGGYAYEDNDFGERWNRAGIPFVVRDDIEAIHQYHPRVETVSGGMERNRLIYERNNAQGIITPANGLYAKIPPRAE